MHLLLTLIYTISFVQSSALYAQYLDQNQLSMKAIESDFCKGNPIKDEEYYYCGFYYGFNPSFFDFGTVFTQLVAINNLNQDYDFIDLILDLELETDNVSISPMIANISSGADLAMRYFT